MYMLLLKDARSSKWDHFPEIPGKNIEYRAFDVYIYIYNISETTNPPSTRLQQTICTQHDRLVQRSSSHCMRFQPQISWQSKGAPPMLPPQEIGP